MQHAPINDPARYRLQKLGMRNAPEVVRQVRVYDFRVAANNSSSPAAYGSPIFSSSSISRSLPATAIAEQHGRPFKVPSVCDDFRLPRLGALCVVTASRPFGASTADVPPGGQLAAELDGLERHEEALIAAAAKAGQDILRRADASPAAVWGVRSWCTAMVGSMRSLRSALSRAASDPRRR